MGTFVPTTIKLPTDASPGSHVYRAFLLDRDGRVLSARVIEAATDDEARSVASRIANACGIDLWERARHLATFPPLSADGAGGYAAPDPATGSTDRL